MIGKWLTPDGSWYFFITLFAVLYAGVGIILLLVSHSRRMFLTFLAGSTLPLMAACVGWAAGVSMGVFGIGAAASGILVVISLKGLAQSQTDHPS